MEKYKQYLLGEARKKFWRKINRNLLINLQYIIKEIKQGLTPPICYFHEKSRKQTSQKQHPHSLTLRKTRLRSKKGLLEFNFWFLKLRNTKINTANYISQKSLTMISNYLNTGLKHRFYLVYVIYAFRVHLIIYKHINLSFITHLSIS